MLRAYDGEVESKARSPVGFLLVAKDLTALGAACERQGSWTHCGTGGFHWRIPTLSYKTKPAEEGQPHPCPLSAPGKGGGYLSVICLLSSQPRLQPIPFSVEWVQGSARGDWLHQETWQTRQDGGSWLRCQPGQSNRAGTAGLSLAFPLLLSWLGPPPPLPILCSAN